jgi:hypothetical protein
MNLKTTDFWEAWKVEKGQLYPKRRLYDKTNKLIPPFTEVEGKFKVTDTSSAATKNNTCGYSSSFGEIRFYCEEGVTGDLAKKWKGVILFWGEGCNKITGAGGVPATEDPPGFWARGPIEGTAARHAQTYWNCCDDCDPPFVAANGYPRKGKN